MRMKVSMHSLKNALLTGEVAEKHKGIQHHQNELIFKNFAKNENSCNTRSQLETKFD